MDFAVYWRPQKGVASDSISRLVRNLAARAALQIGTLKSWIEVVTEGKMVDEEEQSRKGTFGEH